MDATAFSSLAARGIAMRETLFGSTCKYQEHTFTAVATSERDARTLRDGGFSMEYDRQIRMLASALPITPKPETQIEVTGKVYRIKEIRTIPLTGELVLGLVQVA